MSDLVKKFLKDIEVAMIEPTYAKAQELRKRLMLSSSLLGVDGYRLLSVELDKLAVMAAIRDAEKWTVHYRASLQVRPLNHKKLFKCAHWAQNACQLALKTLSADLLRMAKKTVSRREVRYKLSVAKHPDLLMARVGEILRILDEDESHFTEDGAVLIMLTFIHLGALGQIHSR